MSQDQSPDFLKYILLGIDAEYEAAVREPYEIIERAKARRDALIEQAHKSAQGRNGTAMKLPTPPKDSESTSAESTSRENGTATNGHGGNSVSKEVVQRYVDEVMADPGVEIVTQTGVKNRIMDHYRVSKGYLNSLRIQIVTRLNELEQQGRLELVEKAKAGKPNRYRKTGKRMEEAGELVLNSEP